MLAIAHKTFTDFNRVSLSPLRKKSAEEAHSYLLKLPGVGEKSARCVMMYSLGHDISPMDTHAIRVLHRYGVLPSNASIAQINKIMDSRLPKGMAFSLHVDLVAHGRAVCRARTPRCEDCTVAVRCTHGYSVMNESGKLH